MEIVTPLSHALVEEHIRNAPLLQHPEAKPYSESEIHIAQLAIKDIRPCAFYVLKDRLGMLEGLNQFLVSGGFDMHGLGLEENICGLQILDGPHFYTLIPPIVEYHRGVYMLIDGRHRIYGARKSGKEKVSCLVISTKKNFYPLPFLPNPNSWDDISVVGPNSIPSPRKLYKPGEE